MIAFYVRIFVISYFSKIAQGDLKKIELNSVKSLTKVFTVWQGIMVI